MSLTHQTGLKYIYCECERGIQIDAKIEERANCLVGFNLTVDPLV